MKIPEIQNLLEDNYSFFGNNVKVKLLNKIKSNNQGYLISSKKEKFVLHIINENISEKQLETICKVLKFSNNNGSRVQSPIKNNNKNFVNKKFLTYLTSYSIGKQSSGKLVELINLAKHLAKLHSVFVKCKIPFNYRRNQSFYKILSEQDIKKIKNILNKKSNKNTFDKTVLKNLNVLSSTIRKIHSFDLMEKSKSKQLIHFDLHPGNVLFRNNDVVTFLDFHSIRKGIVWEDVAFSSFRFALLTKKQEKISELMKTFLTIYLKNSHKNIEFSKINDFLILRILKSLSYILKRHYFFKENISKEELDKYFKFLKIALELNY